MRTAGGRGRGSRVRAATLIELLVAVVILSLGLLPLLLALNRIYTHTYSLGTRSEAVLLAAEKLDELKSLGFLAIETDSMAGTDSIVINEGALSRKPFSRKTEISYEKAVSGTSFVDANPADAPTNYIKLKSTVSWQVESGLVERSLTAMMTRDGTLE